MTWKVSAFRIDTVDTFGKGWYAFVAAPDVEAARKESRRLFPAHSIERVSGPWEKDYRTVANA